MFESDFAKLIFKRIQQHLVIFVVALITILSIVTGVDITADLFQSVIKEFPNSTPLPIVQTSPATSPLATPLVLSSATSSAKIIKIIDGDTIELESGEKVRYIGIDTPETKHPNIGVECFGKEAAEKNRQLVEGKQVRLEKDVSEVDRYGRLLRYVNVEDQMVNEVLVRGGYANASSYPPDIKHQERLQKAEQEARTQNLGLWSRCSDTISP